jgi:hypothetical protein
VWVDHAAGGCHGLSSSWMNLNADAFVAAATEQRRTRAEAILAASPEIERDPWARLVLGRGLGR